jgi:hypothetical protein
MVSTITSISSDPETFSMSICINRRVKPPKVDSNRSGWIMLHAHSVKQF